MKEEKVTGNKRHFSHLDERRATVLKLQERHPIIIVDKEGKPVMGFTLVEPGPYAERAVEFVFEAPIGVVVDYVSRSYSEFSLQAYQK